jgi:PAS domain S-box-containing protein
LTNNVNTMSNLSQYDAANARFYNCMRIKTLPLYSFDFHHEYTKVLQNTFIDTARIKDLATRNKWKNTDWDLQSILRDDVVIVTDANLKIVFASHNLVKMNGYVEEEVLGQSPKMFQGKVTNKITSSEIKKAIDAQEPFENVVMNYKKNGEVYACLIKGFPVFNNKGELSHYIAFERAA